MKSRLVLSRALCAAHVLEGGCLPLELPRCSSVEQLSSLAGLIKQGHVANTSVKVAENDVRQ
eukprot:12705616-Alexandrium_andersonii.AAC.1